MISKIMIRNVATYDNVGVAVENLGKVNLFMVLMDVEKLQLVIF